MQNARIDVSFKFTRPENHPYSRKGVTFAVHPVDFTFPGEAGCEPPTLDLARRWRTNFIRESDSIHHSPEIVSAGYCVYFTFAV